MKAPVLPRPEAPKPHDEWWDGEKLWVYKEGQWVEQNCDVCEEPVIPFEQARYTLADCRHYDCHVKKFGEPMNYGKKIAEERAKLDDLDRRFKSSIDDLRRALERKK